MYQVSSVGVQCCNEEIIRQGVFNWNQDPRIENIKIVCVGGRSSDGALKIWNVFSMWGYNKFGLLYKWDCCRQSVANRGWKMVKAPLRV